MTDFRAWVATLPPMAGRVHVTPGAVAEIVIDHPESKNALDPHMMVALADAVDTVGNARAIVLRGEGTAFCSGGNLKHVRDHLATPGAGAVFRAFMKDALDRLLAVDGIVIAAVNGFALGGGAELAASCDIVHASPLARIGFVHAKLGVSPGFGGGQRLVRRVGPLRALRLMVDPELLSAADALALGLFDAVTDDPVVSAHALATRIASLSPEAVRAAKRIAFGGEAAEEAAFAELWGGPAHRSALER